MKKSMMLAMILMLGSTVAFATQDRTGKFDAGINVSGALSTDESVDNAVYVGGTLAYGINEWFAVGFESGWFSPRVPAANASGLFINATDFSAVPIFGDLIVRMPIENQAINPYGVLGMGTVVWDADDASAILIGVTPIEGTISSDIATEFAVKLGGGFDWFINNNWIVNFEAAYVFSSPEVTQRASFSNGAVVSVTDNVDLDYWTIGGGLKYAFD